MDKFIAISSKTCTRSFYKIYICSNNSLFSSMCDFPNQTSTEKPAK